MIESDVGGEVRKKGMWNRAVLYRVRYAPMESQIVMRTSVACVASAPRFVRPHKVVNHGYKGAWGGGGMKR